MIPTSPFPFDWVLEHAAHRGDAPAVGTPAGWTTYAELATRVGAMVHELAWAGVGPGSFVLLALAPSDVAVAATLAVQGLGACAVELNRESDQRTLAEILLQTEARHVFLHGRDVQRWGDLLRDVSHCVIVSPTDPGPQLGGTLEGVSWTWIDEHDPPATDAPWRPLRDTQAPALLVYTSGSTGTPRGVVQTHANVDANTRAIAGYLRLGHDDRALSILPLFYCFGRSILQTHLLVGGSTFFDHRFLYPRVVMGALGEQACTGMYGVPLTFELLRQQVDVAALELPSLRYLAQAGGAMRQETIRWVREAFAPAELFVMYGQTEATARLSYLPPERAEDKEGSIGRGLENVTLRVVDPQGIELPPFEVGELVASGASITAGYFRAPEATAAILQDGALWTGDLGWKDEEGFIFLVGRSSDMLKLAGHRVSAGEIERVLLEHPLVREAAVVGVRGEAGEEVAVAFLATDSDAGIDPAEVRRFCRRSLPAFKVPAEVRIVPALPRTPSGKPAKATLREEYDRAREVLQERAAVGAGGEGGGAGGGVGA